jgi:hypothetical protein
MIDFPRSPSCRRLCRLERDHDGPLPAAALAELLAGGAGAAAAALRRAESGLHERLAAEARLGAARRRRRLSPAAALSDGWLRRLCLALAGHRRAAVATAGEKPSRAPIDPLW